MTKKPTISVVLPVCNNENFLSSCLESLLSQSFTDFEIIAIDDASTDSSYSILKQYKKLDKRLKVFKNVKRYGLRLTLNRCIKRTRGQYIAFMRPTDISTKGRLERQLNFLQKNQKIAAVGTQIYSINHKNKKNNKTNAPLEHEEIYNLLLHGVSMQAETLLINRYNLPKDLIEATTDDHVLVYLNLALKIARYGSLANLPFALYLRRETHKHPYLNSLKATYLPYFLKLWLRARDAHDYRPPLRVLFLPLIRSF